MSFQKFRTLNLAKEFYRDCEQLRCKGYMRDQLMRAALSVVNNLGEGSAKDSAKDRARYYRIALGSFRECTGMLDLLDQRVLIGEYDYLGICLYNLHKYTLNPGVQAP